MPFQSSINRIDVTIGHDKFAIIYNPTIISYDEIKNLIKLNTHKNDPRVCCLQPQQADFLCHNTNTFTMPSIDTNNPETRDTPDMSYYIGQEGCTGLKAKTWDEFINYLTIAHEEAVQAKKTQFDVTLDIN